MVVYAFLFLLGTKWQKPGLEVISLVLLPQLRHDSLKPYTASQPSACHALEAAYQQPGLKLGSSVGRKRRGKEVQ
jgi:hypothetical protein